MISREAQKGNFTLTWLVVSMLTLIFVVSAVSEGNEPNAPTRKVKKYHVQKDASGELMKDASGNFIFVPIYVDEPNDVPPVAPPITIPTTQPPAISAALRARLQRLSLDIGPEVYSFKYKEPGLMEDEGTFYGVRFGLTFRDWVPASPKESPLDHGAMLRFDGRFAFGQVDYDGELIDGTPYTIDDIDDFVMENRLLMGADWRGENILNTLYTGIGYRYLNDDSSFDPAGYERESNYYYVPIGYEIDTNLQAGWSFGGRIEFDYLLWGRQRSHLSDVHPSFPDFDDRQNSGHGYRASVRFQNKSKDSFFTIEPFFRYWDINKSEVNYDGGYEPANETTEIGIQLFWIF